MNPMNMILTPHVSEKSYRLGEKERTYAFDVPKDSNKITIKAAVEAQYKVTVTNVNVLVSKGKSKSTGRKNRSAIKGKRSNVRRAYVTLAPGDSITVFETEGEA